MNNVASESSELPPRTVSKTPVFQSQYRSVESWQVRFQGGRDSEFFIQRTPDIVTVCAVTDTNEVLVLREYLFGPEQTAYKLVGGIVDDGKSPKEIAVQELREEAGATAREMIPLGVSFQDKYNTGKCFYFLALGANRAFPQSLGEDEAIQVVPMSMDAFRALVLDGQIHPIADLLCAFKALSHIDTHS